MNTPIDATFPWLTVLVVVPIVAAICLGLIKALRPLAKQIGLAVSLAVLAGTVAALLTEFDVANAGTVQLAETYSWIPSIGVSLAWGLNGVSALMVLLAVLLVPLVILSAHSDRFVPQAEQEAGARSAGYTAWVLALEGIMIAVFAAQDVFLFYVLFEAMLLPVYFLIGSHGGPKRKAAALKFLLYSLAGGLVMLVGVVALFVYAADSPQAMLISNLAGTVSADGATPMLIFLSFFFAFAVKAPMWPVHTWLPDATEEAPAGTSTLLVGVLDKVGTYGMIALCLPLFPDAAAQAAPAIMVLAVISIIWGGIAAIGQRDIMRLIAFTSVSHFGFMVLGIFSGSSVALTGAILYMVAHGISTAALFLVAGSLAMRGGSQQITDFGGWQRVTPVLAGSFLIAGLASLALPGLSGFLPEFLVLTGTYGDHKALAIIAVFGVILAALYILLPYQRMFTGPKPELAVDDLGGSEKTVVGVLVAAMLVLGFYPAPALDLIRPVSEQVSTVLQADSSALVEGIGQ